MIYKDNRLLAKYASFSSSSRGRSINEKDIDTALIALDEITERKIIDEIKNNFEKKTVILVSHKKDNLRHCNKIYEIKKNSINKIS